MDKVDIYLKVHNNEIFFFFRKKDKEILKWKKELDENIKYIQNNNTFNNFVKFFRLKKKNLMNYHNIKINIYENKNENIKLFEISNKDFNIVKKFKNEDSYVIFNQDKIYILNFKKFKGE